MSFTFVALFVPKLYQIWHTFYRQQKRQRQRQKLQRERRDTHSLGSAVTGSSRTQPFGLGDSRITDLLKSDDPYAHRSHSTPKFITRPLWTTPERALPATGRSSWHMALFRRFTIPRLDSTNALASERSNASQSLTSTCEPALEATLAPPGHGSPLAFNDSISSALKDDDVSSMN